MGTYSCPHAVGLSQPVDCRKWVFGDLKEIEAILWVSHQEFSPESCLRLHRRFSILTDIILFTNQDCLIYPG